MYSFPKHGIISSLGLVAKYRGTIIGSVQGIKKVEILEFTKVDSDQPSNLET